MSFNESSVITPHPPAPRTRIAIDVDVRCQLVDGQATLVLSRSLDPIVEPHHGVIVLSDLTVGLPPGLYTVAFKIVGSDDPQDPSVRFHECPLMIGPDAPNPVGQDDVNFQVRSISDTEVQLLFEFPELANGEKAYSFALNAQRQDNQEYVNRDPKVINRGHVNVGSVSRRIERASAPVLKQGAGRFRLWRAFSRTMRCRS